MLHLPSTSQMTLWTWPRGHYPGQMHFYFKAKALPLSVLATPSNPSGSLTIIPIAANPKTNRLAPVYPDLEPQPTDSKLPVMKITNPGDKTTRILHQSTAVVQYLEGYFPPSKGYRDLSGASSPELRAHVRAIVQLITDAMIWMQCDIFNTHPFAISLGLCAPGKQSAAASEYARRRWKADLAKLDRWVQALDQEKEAISLAGALEYPTTADFNLLSAVELFKDWFDTDVFEGFPALERWYGRYRRSEWWVERDAVDRIGEGRYAELYVG